MRPAVGVPPGVDVLAVGEAMAVLCPDPVGPLRAATTLTLATAGAEANVVTHLSRLGLATVFASRVGADPFGELIADTLRAAGVGLALEIDPRHPTGVYFKNPSGYATSVHYYRAGSAASHLDTSLWATVPPARLVHLSGITPALSPSCAALVGTGLAERPIPGAVWSFDVNHRAGLWPAAEAGPVLAALARQADVVFVGLDEAAHLWGTEDAASVRTLLGGSSQLIVKDGPVGATAFIGDEAHFEPAHPVEVVEPVGAGDAFAAGYLYGLLTGDDPIDRLRHGHRLAAAALRTTADVGVFEGGSR
jgi:2-dehydro-3-deoxygluconokinase